MPACHARDGADERETPSKSQLSLSRLLSTINPLLFPSAGLDESYRIHDIRENSNPGVFGGPLSLEDAQREQPERQLDQVGSDDDDQPSECGPVEVSARACC